MHLSVLRSPSPLSRSFLSIYQQNFTIWRDFQSGHVEYSNHTYHTGPLNYVLDSNLRHSRTKCVSSQKLTQSQRLALLPDVVNSLLPVSALRDFPLQLTQKLLLFSRTFSSSLSMFSLLAEVSEASACALTLLVPLPVSWSREAVQEDLDVYRSHTEQQIQC